MAVTVSALLQPADMDPAKILCSPGGKEAAGWCVDFLDCIKTKAQPEGKSKVKEVWDPAPCKEVCGEWPNTSPAEGFLQKAADACIDSCENFQASLSDCVGTILFEPGQLATMAPRENAGAVPERCTVAGDATCNPHLPVQYQECVSHKASVTLGDKEAEPDHCKQIRDDMDTCKGCPQLDGQFMGQFAAFTGGCMDQLHAYHAATHPSAKEAAIPGAQGCKVH